MSESIQFFLRVLLAAHVLAWHLSKTFLKALQSSLVTLLNILPVHNAPNGLEVIGANILVLEIVGVLPDIDTKERNKSNHWILVSSRGDFKLLSRLVVSH
jgi:hypothetical protein